MEKNKIMSEQNSEKNSKDVRRFHMGVLGLGEGRSIMSAALQSDDWELAQICDLNEELCKNRCREFHFDHYTTSYEEMLKDPDVDVIAIYTPDQMHAEHIRMAMEAGKDVICTKPLMISLDRAKELLDVQKRTGRTVFVGQSSRYFEPARRQREDFLAGKHGELEMVQTQYISDSRWFLARDWSHRKGFSWMYNFMIHAVDLAAWYLPDIEKVYGCGVVSENTKSYQIDLPDTMNFLMSDKSGRFASVTGAYAIPGFRSDVEQSISCTLRGSRGISRAGYPKLWYYTKFESEDGKAETQFHDYTDLHPYYFRFEGESHHAGEYQNYIEEYAREMRAGRTPKPDLKEGIHTLAIMEAMEESLRTGQPASVSEVLSRRGIRLEDC